MSKTNCLYCNETIEHVENSLGMCPDCAEQSSPLFEQYQPDFPEPDLTQPDPDAHLNRQVIAFFDGHRASTELDQLFAPPRRNKDHEREEELDALHDAYNDHSPL